MEYLLSYFGLNVRKDNRKCMEFMKQHQTLINECLDNKYSEPKEMFIIKNKTEFLDKIEKNFPNKYIKNNVEKLRKNYNLKDLSDDFRLLFLRYECFCDKNLILKVSEDNLDVMGVGYAIRPDGRKGINITNILIILIVLLIIVNISWFVFFNRLRKLKGEKGDEKTKESSEKKKEK